MRARHCVAWSAWRCSFLDGGSEAPLLLPPVHNGHIRPETWQSGVLPGTLAEPRRDRQRGTHPKEAAK